MNDFRQIFLTDSINNLNNLRRNLTQDFFTENLRRESFRTIHTVKGGAQTFGLQNAARLAEELENILATNENTVDINLLLEGIKLLVNSLESNEAELSADFLEKLGNTSRKSTESEIFLTQIPSEVFRSFSQAEQNAFISASRQKQNIYCVEAGFEVSNFAEQYRNLRKILTEKGEILASLPSEKYKTEGKIGFQIFLASRETAEDVQTAVREFTADVSSHACTDNKSEDLFKMLSQIAAHAENIAERSNKKICISILTNDLEISAEKTKNLFDILLHLVRNAVDHGTGQNGNIEIRLFDETENLYLSVSDDGKGIDPAKIRARAVEKNLISNDDLLNEQQILELIFTPEFSTAERVTEISGRGVGLDAVKITVEKMNGKISVRNRKTNGTIFEIFLPR
jgi:chemotaxis protein histidine kinase CheA